VEISVFLQYTKLPVVGSVCLWY